MAQLSQTPKIPRVRRAPWRMAVLSLAVVVVAGAVTTLALRGAEAATITPGTWYNLVNVHSNKLMEVAGNSTADAAMIQQYDNTGCQCQQFRFEDAGSGYWRIIARHSGKAVDLYNWNTADGAEYRQWPITTGANQQFSVQNIGDNIQLINRHSGKALDLWEWNTANGARISQYTDTNAANQQWRLVVAGTTTPPTTGQPPAGNALYVSPTGTAGNPGTQSAPTTLASAITRVGAGGTIYLRAGTYNSAQTITIATGNNGTASARKKLFAYPGEKPVLNFSAMAEDPANRGLAVNGSYWHINGIIVERAGDNGIFIGGSNNIIERTVTRFNRDSGLQISRTLSSTPKDQWPANNLILSSESHDNADSDGEDADGFAAKLTSGPGNVFRYTVSHNNIDDGWDLYTKPDTGPIGTVTIEDSLAYNNGTLSNGGQAGNGDRNGYKLGGDDIAVNHVVRRSIAYKNGKHGFTYNSNPGTMTISNNLSIDNGERNFQFDAGTSVFRSNTSCRSGSGTNDRTVGNADSSNQFWSGTNGSRCSAYSGALGWSFASDGRLVVTLGGRTVTL